MKTKTVTIRRTTPGASADHSQVQRITMPAPPFDTPPAPATVAHAGIGQNARQRAAADERNARNAELMAKYGNSHRGAHVSDWLN